MKNKNHFHHNGSFLAMVFLAGAALSLIILIFAKNLSIFSKHLVFYNLQTQATTLAESAMHEALGKLTINPQEYLNPNFSNPVTEGNGKYSVEVYRRDFSDVNNGYFIVASATKSQSGNTYNTDLYAYVQISNVGDYFAAIREDLIISNNADVSKGKIYGKRLTFDIDYNPATVTRVKKAEFVYDTNPPVPWSSSIKNEVVITEPSTKEPVRLNYPLLFPQVLESDLSYYRDKALVDLSNLSVGHHACNFSGEIFPPGYCTPKDGADNYANHSNSSREHVYYCTGTMSLRGNVNGQVLFVAGENIVLTGNLTVKDLTTTSENNGSSLPGSGTGPLCASSSTAHQAILITRGTVFIDTNTIVNQYGPFPPATPVPITLQAMILAPNGTIGPHLGGIDTGISQNLKLNFTGSLILATNPDFTSLFNSLPNPRTYAYMETLSTHPPPDLPYLTEVHYSFEK